MASKRRKRRVQCGDKRKWDKAGAIKEATRLRRKWTGQKLDAYPCPHCGSWHVGHRPAHVHQAIKQRKKEERRRA